MSEFVRERWRRWTGRLVATHSLIRVVAVVVSLVAVAADAAVAADGQLERLVVVVVAAVR